MSQRMAAGSSPRESRPCIPHATLLIACDALNARTLTVREYQPVSMSWPASSCAYIAAGWRSLRFSEKSIVAHPPTGSVQTECTRLSVMLRTKGRFLCQRTIGFVGLQKHINSGYAFAERQIAHNGKRGKGTRSPHGLKDYPT